MRLRDFMSLLHDRTLELLPEDLRSTCQARTRFVWFQVFFHSPRVHYEVCLTRKTERIEIGLHFEGPREFSYFWAERMSHHADAIQDSLGPEYELEEWTASWTRLHETIPYDPPSEALAGEIAGRFSRLITVCQPIVEQERPHIPLELEAMSHPSSRRPRRGFRGHAAARR
jgi:hypothetical protein